METEHEKTIRIPDGPILKRPSEPQFAAVDLSGRADDGPTPGLYQVAKDENGSPIYAPLGQGLRLRWPHNQGGTL